METKNGKDSGVVSLERFETWRRIDAIYREFQEQISARLQKAKEEHQANVRPEFRRR